jgi:serine protease Do
MTSNKRKTKLWLYNKKAFFIRQYMVREAFLFIFLFFILTPFTFANTNTLSSLRNLGNDFADIVKKVSPAVVFVKVEQIVESQSTLNGQNTSPNNPFAPFNDEFMHRFFGEQFQQRQTPKQQQRAVGQGSGFIISQDGYILTNNHVAGEADKITVKLQDGREYQAKLIGTDTHSDVAVIKIDANNLSTLTLGNSDNLEVGEWVLAFGNPFGLSHTVTAGIVSAKGRSNVGIADYEDFIQTDAAINPGNSGGPLINLDGEVVGINTAIFSKSGGYMGIGFTIPVNMVKTIKDQLIKYGEMTRGYLGVSIQDLTLELAESFGLKNKKGILIADVVKDAPADKSGIKHGDVIFKLNGKIVEDVAMFRNEIALILPGKIIKLTLWRNGIQKLLNVTIAKYPDSDQVSSTGSKRLEKIGLTLNQLTPQLAEKLGYQGESGVLIATVQNGSKAARVGLRPGMLIQEVNQKPVYNIEDFMKNLPQKGSVLFLVRAGQQSMFLSFTLN